MTKNGQPFSPAEEEEARTFLRRLGIREPSPEQVAATIENARASRDPRWTSANRLRRQWFKARRKARER